MVAEWDISDNGRNMKHNKQSWSCGAPVANDLSALQNQILAGVGVGRLLPALQSPRSAGSSLQLVAIRRSEHPQEKVKDTERHWLFLSNRRLVPI